MDHVLMLKVTPLLCLLLIACGPTKQPEWARTVAAYEVPLPDDANKAKFTDTLSRIAKAHGFHVDSSTPQELKAQSDVSPITFNAAVWRGKDDEEAIASAMDFKDHIGRVWVSFSLGQDPERSAQFRNDLMEEVIQQWPQTARLPIMPNGAIPLTDDLVRTPKGYEVKSSMVSKYER